MVFFFFSSFFAHGKIVYFYGWIFLFFPEHILVFGRGKRCSLVFVAFYGAPVLTVEHQGILAKCKERNYLIIFIYYPEV